ncbi:MAG: FAD-dependent oxidoreductase, partial [Candidatus Bathyarchaeia archaeon]
MTRYDIVVIGGGPAGAVAAAEVARAGFRTAVFEEHQTIGNPRHCTGK